MAKTFRAHVTSTALGETVDYLQDFTVDEADFVDVDIPINSTNLEVDFAPGAYSKMSALMIKTNAPLTIKANSSSTPDWTITAFSGCVLLTGAAIAALGGTTITKFFITNASGTVVVKLQACAARDVTP